MEEQQPSQDTASFIQKLDSIKDIEEKLRASIQYMKDALAQEGMPNFKGFWEVRKLCLPFFKESLPVPVRSSLWNEYIELTREGRRLKNLLDQETAFAVEQIELAISSLEVEVKTYQEDPESAWENAPIPDLPPEPKSLEGRYPFYEGEQKDLNVLNMFASRVNALRKELIKTEMRIRLKNKFFQRLSSLGDQIFPPRKTKIKELSDAFIDDVTRFVDTYFSSQNFSHDKIRRSVFFFREEIKALQALAKALTLNTHAFSYTREQLSQCWDKLKGMEKELKKEFAAQKQISSENVENVLKRIQAFSESYAQGNVSDDEAYNELENVSRWMRELDLTRFDVKTLKEALKSAREPLEAKLYQEEEARRLKQEELEQERLEKLEAFKSRIESLKASIPEGEIEDLARELEECRKELLLLSASKAEKQSLDRVLKGIREQISEKKEHALLNLPEGERAALENLKEILSERNNRRKEIKIQIEDYRKIIGGSGLDFEKAMRYNELMVAEKERLAKIEEGISEIEQKIRELKNRV